MNPVDKMKAGALDIAFPRLCFGCQQEGLYLCPDCRGLLEILEHQYCLCSGKPFPLPAQAGLSAQAGTCSACRQGALSGLLFAVPYRVQTIKRMVYQFKYEPYAYDLAATLASVIVEHLVKSRKNTDDFWDNALLVPVPLDDKKLRFRGYNQSALLARELSKAISVPVTESALVKTRATKAQMELKKEEREINLAGAFAAANAPEIIGKKIFLVDDVYTTGSTLSECARVLKNARAKEVWGITVAREE